MYIPSGFVRRSSSGFFSSSGKNATGAVDAGVEGTYGGAAQRRADYVTKMRNVPRLPRLLTGNAVHNYIHPLQIHIQQVPNPRAYIPDLL